MSTRKANYSNQLRTQNAECAQEPKNQSHTYYVDALKQLRVYTKQGMTKCYDHTITIFFTCMALITITPDRGMSNVHHCPQQKTTKLKLCGIIGFHLEKAPENGANKIDMSVHDKKKEATTLISKIMR